MVRLTASPDWIPCRFFWQAGQPIVDWCYLDRRRFTDSFFEATLQKCMRLPFNMLFRRQTPVETLLEWQAARPGIPPTGFVFHMSRCGSTLVAQTLAALSQNIVLSEARPIDDVLNASRRSPTVTTAQRIEWLRAMVSVLGQKRHHDEHHLFIKFDCWHTQELPLLRAAFPETPWVFLYREPHEVMVSQMTSRGSHLVPNVVDCVRFGIDQSIALQLSPEEYSARVLAAILEAAIEHQSVPGGMLVNYTQLPQATTTSISNHFGVTWSADELEQMRNVTQFDAKNPSMNFTDDRQEKQRAVTEAIAAATQKWLTSPYQCLEALRLKGEENR